MVSVPRFFCFPVYDKHDNPLTSEEEEQRAIAKIKMLGNIKFIGELGKLDLIHESILHKCIKTVRDTRTRAQTCNACVKTKWRVEFNVWPVLCSASGKEEESPAQRHGGGSIWSASVR